MKKILAVCGVARSGKDLFCQITIDQLKKRNLNAKRFALADKLKEDCQDFLREKCQLDVWTKDSTEKSKLRELLVWYGNFKRDQTEGKYWTGLLEPDINKSDCDVAIVTDIRYDMYPEDEAYWIKNIMKGKLVHITKHIKTWNSNTQTFDSGIIEPANIHEELNNPKMKQRADFIIDWDHQYECSQDELIDNSYLIEKVNSVLFSIL